MDSSPLDVVRAAWADLGDPRPIVEVHEISANVSTNRVYRVVLGGAGNSAGNGTVVCKVSSYGSYFLFAEDHDRLHRCARMLATNPETKRWAPFLANVLERDGRPFTWYDGSIWAVFYEDVPRAESLPRVLSLSQVENLGREMAEFHAACQPMARQMPPTSNSVKGDLIHLLDLLESPFASRNFNLNPEDIGILHRDTHQLLLQFEACHYDEWLRIPVLIDWNLGNFSVVFNNADDAGSFRLFSRWDYDWFRLESRVFDFYFLSRVSSSTGDRTMFTYSPHTLLEPRFIAFLRAYHDVNPLTAEEVRFIPLAYRFFLLNYVIREGARFFRDDLCRQFREEVARRYLRQVATLDFSPLVDALHL
ncbi:MAG: hypothetical protein KJS66_05370 [Acidobacteria bacterium]|nr:hypothetical protein [Acidobacteriota bacterium]